MNKFLAKANNSGFNYYGSLVDSIIPPVRENSRDISRNTVHAQSIPSKKRTFEQMKEAYTKPKEPPKRRLRRGADNNSNQKKKKGNETDSQAEESGMEDDKGGSS